MDDGDVANDRADLMLSHAINNRVKFDTKSLTECLDCGEPISLKRQQLGGVKRCVDCQAELEKSQARR